MLPLSGFLKIYTEDEKFLSPKYILGSIRKYDFVNLQLDFVTPTYNPSHQSRTNKILAGMMQMAASLSSRPGWQSFFIISGQK